MLVEIASSILHSIHEMSSFSGSLIQRFIMEEVVRKLRSRSTGLDAYLQSEDVTSGQVASTSRLIKRHRSPSRRQSPIFPIKLSL
uniref:Ovule protein n=1 Tax=Echinococcus granulosus TaxID=6210 RepID=A0A068WER9_ECHGR|nr:hypothetical protein EgrG_000638100 [Echinococcus granulosus]